MPSIPIKLTHAFCRSVTPSDVTREYLDGHSRLALRVTKTGSKSWTMRYRLSGKEQRLTFGPFRLVSLAQARKRCAEASLLVLLKRDPRNRASIDETSLDGPATTPPPPIDEPEVARKAAVARPEVPQNAQASLLVDEVGELYLEACELGRHKRRRTKNKERVKKPRTIKEERSVFERFIAPRLGQFRPDDLDSPTIQDFVNDIEREASEGAARQAKKTLHGIYSYGVWQGYAKNNPCVKVDYPPCGTRDTILSDEQLRMVWRTFSPPVVVPDKRVSPGVAYAFLLAAVLLQRIGEIAQMRVSQLDLRNALWEIPKEVTKNHRDHVVPLTPLAVELIEKALAARGIESDAVFPGCHDPSASIRPNAVSQAFLHVRRSLGRPNLWVHDLRRTGSTRLGKLGVLPFIISKVLNHVSDTGGAAPVTGLYNRYAYLKEKRNALHKWEKELRRVLRNAD
ncbi:site-specific integrase [Ensifer sp. ENS12]|uniref:tyrosine-type recombinase/integrase n=1 Tax=Ensifer sp. ENS12 TaxID=2854774 RepID=UPI001C48D883|nr:site-specific integrase [Ensifer sp. ENS12]MBV7522115.1 tyrosine-type recombinase/integrase [Ensifer sp. ENS12]